MVSKKVKCLPIPIQVFSLTPPIKNLRKVVQENGIGMTLQWKPSVGRSEEDVSSHAQHLVQEGNLLRTAANVLYDSVRVDPFKLVVSKGTMPARILDEFPVWIERSQGG